MRPLHGTEHPAGEFISRKLRQQIAVAHIHRHIATKGDYLTPLPFQLSFLHQQGQRYTARLQSHLYHLRAFGYEDTLFGLQPIA